MRSRSFGASFKGILGGLILVAASATYAGEYLSGAADYIYSPTVEEGEREIDTKFGTQTPKGAEDPRQSGASIGFGYGVNSWWFTEVYGKAQWESNNAWRIQTRSATRFKDCIKTSLGVLNPNRFLGRLFN